MNGTTMENSSINTIYPNKLVNITMKYDGANAKIYIDGILIYTNNGGGLFSKFQGDIVSSIKHLIIGNSGWSYGYTRAFKGKIDEIRIYNRVLSDAEIKTLYDSSK